FRLGGALALMSDPIPMPANRRRPTGCVALTVLAEPIQIERLDDSSPRMKAKIDRRLNMHYKLSAASLLMCLVACATVRNVSPPPIAVPNKLTENDVELAILMAIADRAVSPKLTAGEKVTDRHLSMVNDPASNSARRQKASWYFEDRGPRM